MYANKFFSQISFFNPADLLGQELSSILAAEEKDNQTLINDLDYFIEEQAMNNQLKMRNKAGNLMPINISFNKHTINQKQAVLCKIDDISVQEAYEKVIHTGYDQMQKASIQLENAIKKINQQKVMLQAYKEKLNQEIKVARMVQDTIFPKNFPQIEGMDLYGVSLAGDSLNGDYFDVFTLSRNRIGLAVADVSGHGVAASLLTTMLKAHFEHYTARFQTPEEVLFHINNSLATILAGSGVYLTALYGVIDIVKSELRLCSAGHESALIFDPDGDKPIRLGSDDTGFILGLDANSDYKAFTYTLKPGSRVVFFTDGITEARNSDNIFWGIENLINHFKENVMLSARECTEGLFKKIYEFYNKEISNDDRTIVYFKIGDDFIKNRQYGSQIHIQHINGLLSNKKYEEAVNYIEKMDFNKVLENDFYFIKAKAYYLADRLYQSEENLKFCLNLDPENLAALYLLGMIYFRQQKYQNALTFWEKILKIDMNYKKTLEYLNLTRARLKK